MMISSESKIKSKRDGKLATKTAPSVAYEESKEELKVSHQGKKLIHLINTHLNGFFKIAVDGVAEQQEVQKQPVTLCSNCQTSKPKGVRTAYMFFSLEMVAKMREESKISMIEAVKRTAPLWAELEDKTKFNLLND